MRATVLDRVRASLASIYGYYILWMVPLTSFDNQNGPTLSDQAPLAKDRERRGSGWVSMAVGATIACTVLLGLFGDVLTGARFLAFRDAMHFYPPLYRLVASEWLSGRVPLWNPWLNGGQPLAAMNTAGVFYPPQVLATCLLPDGVSLSMLMIGHVALAGAAAFVMARDAGASRDASLLAGLSFALSGSMLFNIYNANALAGVAWAAWAVRAGIRLLERFDAGDFLVLALALACAVLAGDPQSTVHAGIVVGIVLWCRHRWPAPTQVVADRRAIVGRCGVLVAAAMCGGLLSCVQLGLTREFMLTTTRSTDSVPVSLWDVPAFLWRASPDQQDGWYSVLLGRPPESVGFYHEIYRYSMAPWWFLECLSPTLAGPFLGRWPRSLGWEGEAWVATLYAGVIPLACALVAIAVPRARCAARGWCPVLAFSSLAALGGFGAVGGVRHVIARITGATDVAFYLPGDEVGGLYWMLVSCVPGYSGFRYPAKWLAIFALAFSQLAASGFDAILRDSRTLRLVGQLIMGLGGFAMLATVVALSFAGESPHFILAGGILALVVAALATGIAGLARGGRIAHPLASAMLVGLAAVDLVVAGRFFIYTSPFTALVEGGAAVDTLRQQRLPDLATTSAVPRLGAIDNIIHLPMTDDPSDRALIAGMAMRGNTPLLHRWGKFGEPSTAMEADLERFFQTSRAYGESRVFSRRMFDSASVEFFVVPLEPPSGVPLSEFERDWSDAQKRGVDEGPVPIGARMPGTLALPAGVSEQDAFVKYIRNDSAEPRARIAKRVLRGDPVGDQTDRGHAALMASIAFPNPKIPVLGSTVVVETAAPVVLPDRTALQPPAASELCRVVVDEPRRVVVEATLTAPGLVVLADTFHPDWVLRVRSNDGQPRKHDILRVNRIHRGCMLPAGHHLLEYTHTSAVFERTWPVTLGAWMGMIAAAVWLLLRRTGPGIKAPEPILPARETGPP